jgi:integrase
MDICNLYRIEHLPALEHSTRSTNEYVLTHYIEDRFGHTPIREVKPLAINTWIQNLKLSATTKAIIRSVMSVCFRLAALHELIPPMQQNPMSLIRLKGVTKRQKRIPQITVENFKKLLAKLPEPLNTMVLVTGSLGLRISETLALKWEDVDTAARTILIRRKFTRGHLGNTKTAASEAPLPLAKPLLEALLAYKPRTGDSEWVFPSPRTGGPRSASMLLQKGIKPAADQLGLGRITWHSLRHACRSWLSSGGAAIGTQKDLLRHSNVSTTMDVYGAALTDDMRKAHEDLVGKLLG